MTTRLSTLLRTPPQRMLRDGLGLPAARRLGLVAATVTFLVTSWTGLLVLHNIYGPLGDATGAAFPIALSCGTVVAAGVHQVLSRLARRSAAGAAGLLALLVVTGWVLLPHRTDVHESFVPRPNERSACTGWSFRYYPPETFDASAVVYCVGLETPLPDG